jgi:hypothetical protein
MNMQRRRRSCRGQALIEGALGVVLVLGGGVLASMLVLNSGFGALFKNKISLVANQAAQFAVSHASDSDLQSETNTFVEQLMPEVGLTPRNLNVTLKLTTTGTQTGVLVSVANDFSILGNGTMFPAQLRMSDTEFASTYQGD